jgi:glutamyl-Q tRNA(Asp) synthetase
MDGTRLAKRDQALTLASLRDQGVDGPELIADLLEAKLPFGFALTAE